MFRVLLLTLLFLCSALGCSFVYAQVNTEAMQRPDLPPGVHHRIGIGFEYQSGNSDYLGIAPSYRLDLVGRQVYGFLVASYDRRTTGNEPFRHEGFAHARLILAANRIYRPEMFVQKEFNDFILLRDRNLAGAGLRIRAMEIRDTVSRMTFDIGIGAMFEAERINIVPEERTDLVRSTNYIAFNARLAGRVSASLTTYYQPALTRASDFRILSDGELTVQIGGLFSLTTGARYRYDSDPPDGLKKYDFKLFNGVAVNF